MNVNMQDHLSMAIKKINSNKCFYLVGITSLLIFIILFRMLQHYVSEIQW